MPARSSSMPVQRATSKHYIEYNAATDELIIQTPGGPLCLAWDKFIEAILRRIDDDRYRPLTETQRTREAPDHLGR